MARWMAVMAGAKNRIPALFSFFLSLPFTDSDTDSAEDFDHGSNQS